MGVEFIQSVTGSGWLSFGHQEWHSLWMRLGNVVSRKIIKKGVWGACGQVEVFGFTHNASVIYNQMVCNCKWVLVFSTIEKSRVKITAGMNKDSEISLFSCLSIYSTFNLNNIHLGNT